MFVVPIMGVAFLMFGAIGVKEFCRVVASKISNKLILFTIYSMLCYVEVFLMECLDDD